MRNAEGRVKEIAKLAALLGSGKTTVNEKCANHSAKVFAICFSPFEILHWNFKALVRKKDSQGMWHSTLVHLPHEATENEMKYSRSDLMGFWFSCFLVGIFQFSG